MKHPWSVSELRERAKKLPRVSLTPLPTPFQELPRLGAALGGKVRLFAKRDDLTATGLGGNKIRKLEFSLGEATATGCDVVVHGLAGQSNYCRQTAAAAAKVGLPCVLVLRQDHKAEDPPQGNRLLDFVFGAEVRMVPVGEQKAAIEALVAELRAKGRKPYAIGPHDEVLGAVSYALCLAEIMEQQAQAGVRADYVCASSRYGTLGGLVLGKRLLGFEGKVMGIDVDPRTTVDAWRQRTAQVATDAAALLGADVSFTADDLAIDTTYAGTGYGIPTEAGLDAILLLGRTEGLVVGPVYTAKGLSGMIDYVRKGRIMAGSTAVFVHTGGLPEVFAYNTEVIDRLRKTK